MPRMLTMAAALALAAALLPGGLAGDGAAQARTDETVTVGPGDLGPSERPAGFPDDGGYEAPTSEWYTPTHDDDPDDPDVRPLNTEGATYGFVGGPDPDDGFGSFLFDVPAGERSWILTDQFGTGEWHGEPDAKDGARLDELTALRYSTYISEELPDGTQQEANLVPSLQIMAEDPDAGFLGLVFDPPSDDAATGVWQEWDAIDPGEDYAGWRLAWEQGAEAYMTWDGLLDEYEEAEVLWAIGVAAGTWPNQAFHGYTDLLTVGVEGQGATTFDFEPPVVNETRQTGHATIQEAVDEAEEGDVLRAAPGVYDESITINGVEGLNLIGDDGAVIEGQLRIGNPSSPDSASGTTVEGFALRSGKGEPTGSGIGVTESDEVVLRDLTVEAFATGVSLDFAGATPSDVTIEGSEFASNGTAIGSTEDVETLTVTDNTFTGNNNGVGLGSGADDVTVSGNTFDPDNNAYLTDYRDPDAAPSLAEILGDNDFERAALVGDVGRVRPDMSSALGSSIGLASALAAEGATIEVIAGRYKEEVRIDAADVELRGPNAGVSGASGDRVDEAVIDGKVVIDDVDDVTVDGFTIEDGGDRLVQPQDSDGTEVRNNVLRESLRAVQGDVRGRPDNLTVDGNLFETDFGIAGTEGVDGLTVEGNVFATTEEGIGLGGGAGDVTVEGNRFEGDGEHIRIYDGALVPGFLGLYLADNDFATAATARNGSGSVLTGPAIYASVQGAIDDAAPGETVRVEAGTYTEDVDAHPDGIALEGPNAGTAGASDDRGDEAVVEGTVTLSGSGVTLDGFTVEAPEDNGFVLPIDISAADPTVANLIVEGGSNAAGIQPGSLPGPDGVAELVDNLLVDSPVGAYTGFDEVEVSGNVFEGSVADEAVWVAGAENPPGGEVDADLVIEGNDFCDVETGEQTVKIVAVPASFNGNDDVTAEGVADALFADNVECVGQELSLLLDDDEFTVTATAPDPGPGPAPDPDPDDEDEVPDDEEGVLGDDVARLAGETRVETAVRISEEQFEEGSVDTVILARDNDYADALAAGPLAYAVDAPILLTPTGDLDAATAAEVDRLGAEQAYVLGLEAAISTSAEDELVAETGVSETTRLAGTDRFETAVEIAGELAEVTGVEGFGEVYLTEGTNADPLRGWPDAVAVSGLASAQQRPILLATADDLPEATSEALGDLDVDEVTIVGGPAAVSAEVEATVEGLVAGVERLDGPNRYATSVAVAEASVEAGFGPERVWLATGRNFPDAVAGGPAVARDGGVLVLVDGDDPDDSPDSIGWLNDNAEARERLRLLGGEEAIAQSVLDALGE